MPFTFKLSKRLALMKASLAACEIQGTRVTDPTPPGHPVVQIITVPDAVTLDPYNVKTVKTR
ncbi:MAG TPA: hypothetical protein VEM13_09175 [Gemmatimonadales bacterium]|nr:hypothetical protein [Gemmatimonadales bacterium]